MRNLWMLALACISMTMSVCVASGGEVSNNKGDVVVSWRIDDGYKVSVRILTLDKKEVFRKDSRVDVSNIRVEFLDVNHDGFDDVLVKYSDESGFEFDVFVNVGGEEFVDSLRATPGLYVITEMDFDSKGNRLPVGSVYLKDVDYDSVPEIVAEKVEINGRSYRLVVLKYNENNKLYSIVSKK